MSQNRAKLVFVKKTEPNRTETGQFEPVSFFLKKKIWFGYFFFYKNQIEPKIITPNFYT
jgi:hypothetical protein